jgi:hypothetical protein
MMNLRVASSGRDAEKSRKALFPQDTKDARLRETQPGDQ